MSQTETTREKRVPKVTAKSAQFRESIAADKKRQEESQYRKDLKAQGVGSTVPAKEYDATLAEIQAEEARVNALRAKLAARDNLRFKDLRLKDEEELQRLWDNRKKAKGKATEKAPSKVTKAPEKQKGGKAKTQKTTKKATATSQASSTSSSLNSKVQAMGPSQKILSSASSLSPVERAPAKRKRSRSSSTTPKPRKATGSDQSRGAVRDNSKVGSDEDSDSEDEGEDESAEDIDAAGDDGGDSDGENGSRKPNKKTGDSAKRGRTKDFTGRAKKMVDYTTIRVCAKLAATGMFCSPRQYKSLVNKCWIRAAEEYGVDYQSSKYSLGKKQRQAIRSRVNSFRSRIRDRLKSAVIITYKLLADGQKPEEARHRVAELLPHVYHTKPGAGRGLGHFQHDFLQTAIFEAYYTGNNPVGLVYPKWFDPMPLEAIGLVCAVIQWVIKQHETGKFENIRMTFEKLREYYDELMGSLRAFQTGRQADRCACVQSAFYVRSMEHAGRSVREEDAKPVVNALGEDDFAEDIPTAEELKLVSRGSGKRRDTTRLPQSRPHSSSPHRSNITSPPKYSRGSPQTDSARSQRGATSPTPDNNRKERSSSVSLDYEENESNYSREGTPTPQSRTSQHTPTTKQLDDDKPAVEDGDTGTDDSEDDNKAASSGEDDTSSSSDSEETQQSRPTRKKQKTETGAKLIDRFVGSASKKKLGSGKPSPGAALKAGVLKLTQNAITSKASKLGSKLKIQS